MLHTRSVNWCQRGRGSDVFKKIFCHKTYFFSIGNQENTTICLLQPKVLGRNDLCMNNRCIIFIRFITINNTVRHLCSLPPPLAQTWHFDIICHLPKYSCAQNILIGQGGGGGHGLIIKGFLFPI